MMSKIINEVSSFVFTKKSSTGILSSHG
jgi:hypothetical protein